MNERIKKLAEQAGFKVNWQHEDVQAIKMARFEKFAELIVKECADDAKHHVMNISTYADADFVYEQIKRHFGVEE